LAGKLFFKPVQRSVMIDKTMEFEDIFRSYYGVLHSVANNIIRDGSASDDIVQEVFLAFWKKRGDGIHDRKKYLYRSTINAAFDFLKKNKNNVPIALERKLMPAYDHVEKALDAKELEGRIRIAFERLPPRCKVIFSLSRFEDMSYREIAEHLDLSVKTVENQMGIALAKLREDLKPFLTREFLTLLTTAGIAVSGSFLLFHLL
jgi:RNA polymerase sigma-70 factor (ECF subfamily)